MQGARRIGVLVGSSRQGGNGPGIASWLAKIVQTQLTAAGQPVEVVTVSPTAPPHPLGAVRDGSKIPAQITEPSGYASPAVQEWSRFVSSCAAFAVVSPEYNGGYPGELKNSLDHLFHEWAGKPVVLLTYGGGGGGRASSQLQAVLPALKLQVLESPVAIKLPRTFISGTDRVLPDGEFPEFLSEYEASVSRVVRQLGRSLSDPNSATAQDTNLLRAWTPGVYMQSYMTVVTNIS